MRRPAKFYLLLISMLLAYSSYGQLIKGFSLGQASDNSFTQGESADFIAVFPENVSDSVKNSYKINGYASLKFIDWKNLSVSLSGELHQNTLIEKEQYVEQYGISIKKIFLLIKESGEFEDIHVFDLYTDLSVLYSNNKIKKKEGTNAVVGLSAQFPKAWDNNLNFLRPYRFFPTVDKKVSNWIQARHTHNIGIDYLGEENLIMSNLSFGLELYPFSGYLKKWLKQYNILQLKGAVVQRDKLNTPKNEVEAGTLLAYGIALNYKFDDEAKSAISLGYEVIDGANPMKGLQRQQYDQLTLKLKIKID